MNLIVCRDRLEQGVQQLEQPLSKRIVDQLLEYLLLLDKWNKAYNLTAVRDPFDMVSRHLLDSLSIAPFIRGKRLIDVGSGGGLPGIVLAILNPEKKIDLLDSNGKKTRFLFQVKTALNLNHVEVHHCRVEAHQPNQRYDAVVSRAFASLSDMVQGSRHLLVDKGRFFAMKGLYPQQELSELEKGYKVEACHELVVPFEEGKRHLIELSTLQDPSN